MADNLATADLSEEQKNLEKAIYFFRTGDLTAWNYAILALAFLGLFLGLFLLIKNIFNNKKRKTNALYQIAAKQPDEMNAKQVVVSLEKDDQAQEDSPLKKELEQDDIRVEWIDGQVTALYREVPEADV